MIFLKAARLLIAVDLCFGFSPIQHTSLFLSRAQQISDRQCFRLCMSADGNRGGSRFEGNSRPPSAEELVIMDEMVGRLADAKPYELPNAVRRAFRVISSPQFFVRIAELTDLAQDTTQKEKLAALSVNLVNTVEVVIQTTEETLDERALDVENIVKAAAEPDSGEFLVPLLPERVTAMRKALEELPPSSLDEGFLSTVDSWMNKSHLDGLDLMVQILQTLLQMYAGIQIYRTRLAQDTATKPAAELFDRMLKMDSGNWEDEVRKSEVPSNKLIAEVQRTMEIVVLGLENGSIAQQVQAEYLRELVTRIEAIEKNM